MAKERPRRASRWSLPFSRAAAVAAFPAIVGVIAASSIAVFLNVLSARHYRRWDVTSDLRFTLSPATLATLHSLPDPVQVWVLLSANEPLLETMRPLLVAYQAESPKLDVRYVDPDKDAVLLEEVRKRFRVDTGQRGDGHVVTDAIAVVAAGDRHWFIGPTDLVEIADNGGGHGPKVKPREEQALTHAIRQVISGEKVKLCFTVGHGELSIDGRGEQGAGALRAILEKDNFDVVAVDSTAPDAFEPFKGCGVVVIAAPRGAFAHEEANRLRTYLLEGGASANLLAVLGPVASPDAASPDAASPDADGFDDSGLEHVLAPFGIALDKDVVVEVDPSRVLPDAHGASFFAEVKDHATTELLVPREDRPSPPRVLVQFARSMRRRVEVARDAAGAAGSAGPGEAVPVVTLTTSDGAFGLTSIRATENFAETPKPRDADLKGPLTLGMASERPKPTPSALRGARVVVIGSSKIMDEKNLEDPLPFRGASIVLESSISWLASRPAILDVPARTTVAAGLRISDESRSEIRRYVVVLMPLAAALIAMAVGLRRRSTEGQPEAERPRPPRANEP